jgi:cell division septum initiation protein DivIVA
MKTIKQALFVGIILLSYTGYAQSKKDLKLQVQQLEQELSKSKNQADSLNKIQNKQISDLNKQVKTLSDTLSVRTKALESKQAELDNIINGTSRMGGRVRLKDPDLSKVVSYTPVTISLKLLVDENGMVVEAINDSKKTTTTDKALLDQVINAVKKDLRYSKEKGASLLQANFTVKLGPK